MKPEEYDPEGAKKLLAEAGYPNGFTMTLATPNNRYINDEQVAQACAQMFSRIGVTTRVDAMPLAVYLGKARTQEFGVALLGWGSLALGSRVALARSDAQPGQRLGRMELGALFEPRARQTARALARVPWTPRSASRSRAS